MSPFGQQPQGQLPGQFGQRPQAPWGQQPPPGQWQQPQPPKRSNPLRMLVLAVAAVMVFATAGLVIHRLSGGGETADGYQNDNYTAPPPDANPPALPMPTTKSQAESWLTGNPLYQQTVPRPVRCEIQEIDLTSASKSQVKQHMDQLTACLMQVWAEPLQKAGFTAVRPVSNVYSGTVNSDCGKLPAANAVYCGANQQIYYSMDLPKILPANLRTKKFVVESVIAHEFGHAIQGRTGILMSYHALAQQYKQKGDDNTYLSMSRRTEVQADCFSGMFLGSVAKSTGMTQGDLDTVMQLFKAIGDDELSGKPNVVGNHGRGASRQYWGQMGMASTNVGACNSWSAAASLVK